MLAFLPLPLCHSQYTPDKNLNPKSHLNRKLTEAPNLLVLRVADRFVWNNPIRF